MNSIISLQIIFLQKNIANEILPETTHNPKTHKLFGVWPLSGIFEKKTPKCTWLCTGISLVWYALQTR